MHALSPQGLAEALAAVVESSVHAIQAAEMGEEIALGRYQPGSGRIGSLIASIVRDACAGTAYSYCAHGLVASLTVLSAAYGLASRRGRVDRDTVSNAVQTVLAHTGERDVDELVKAVEAARAEFTASLDLADVARRLRDYNPAYTCLAEPSTCIRLAAEIGDPFNRVNIVSFWLKHMLPRCTGRPVEGLDPGDAKRLLAFDAECKRRYRNRILYCARLAELLASAAFLSVLIP